MVCKKQGAKKQGHCYLKRGEAAWPLLFFKHNDPAFCNPYFGPFFTGSQTDPCFQNKNSGCRLTGRVWCQFVRCCGYIFVVKAYTVVRKEYTVSQGCIKMTGIKMGVIFAIYDIQTLFYLVR